MYFLIEVDVIPIGIKSALILKWNLIASLSLIKCLKTKIKSYGDEVTDFYNKEILKVNSNHSCLAVIKLDSAIKEDENYYLQLFFKKGKCVQKN